MNQKNSIKSIRRLVLLFMFALFFSGLTAIPIDAELRFVLRFFPQETVFRSWLQNILQWYQQAEATSPVLFYGYDWLAFAHFLLAYLFWGVYQDPVKNTWVIQFGFAACVLVIPFAFVAGHFRGIPIGWRLIDCSFGVFGFAVLYLIDRKTKLFISNYNQHGNNCANHLV